MLKFTLVLAAILLHVVASQPININVDVDVKVPNSQPEAPTMVAFGTTKEGLFDPLTWKDAPKQGLPIFEPNAWKDAPPQPETKNSQEKPRGIFPLGYPNWGQK